MSKVFRYINFTGPDGSGKDTTYNEVIKKFPNATKLREPGGSKEAEKIRSVILDIEDDNRLSTIEYLLNSDEVLEITKEYLRKAYKEIEESGITSVAEVYLYAASRAQTNRTIVKPTVENGGLVFGSRSVACSMAYQAKARGLGYDFVWEQNQKALNVLPDLEIYFDIPTDVALSRLEQRTGKQDRLDNESMRFHSLSKLGYEEYYENHCPYQMEKIDASGSKDDVYEEVIAVLRKYNILNVDD